MNRRLTLGFKQSPHIMNKPITRRSFLKRSASTGSFFSLAGVEFISLAHLTEEKCDNCGFVKSGIRISLFGNPTANNYCTGCGINISTNTFPSNDNCSCTYPQTVSYLKGESSANTPCSLVPFPPTQDAAKHTGKPFLQLAHLQF